MPRTDDLFEWRTYESGKTYYSQVYPWGEANNAIVLWGVAGFGDSSVYCNIVLEDSPDGESWTTVATPISGAKMIVDSYNFERGTVSPSTPFGKNVRFALTITAGSQMELKWRAYFRQV